MVTILMMSAKMATLEPLKVKPFWNKGYNVKSLSMASPEKFNDVTQNIL